MYTFLISILFTIIYIHTELKLICHSESSSQCILGLLALQQANDKTAYLCHLTPQYSLSKEIKQYLNVCVGRPLTEVIRVLLIYIRMGWNRIKAFLSFQPPTQRTIKINTPPTWVYYNTELHNLPPRENKDNLTEVRKQRLLTLNPSLGSRVCRVCSAFLRKFLLCYLLRYYSNIGDIVPEG